MTRIPSIVFAVVALLAVDVCQASDTTIVNRRGFFGRNVTRISSNSRNSGANFQINVNGFSNFNRANVFGTRTIIDNGGNVFEVDSFGNTRFRGNSFRGFNSGFNSFNSFNSFQSFGGGGFNSFNSFGGCR